MSLMKSFGASVENLKINARKNADFIRNANNFVHLLLLFDRTARRTAKQITFHLPSLSSAFVLPPRNFLLFDLLLDKQYSFWYYSIK